MTMYRLIDEDNESVVKASALDFAHDRTFFYTTGVEISLGLRG